jgi:tRNA pseudouridine13 synthase
LLARLWYAAPVKIKQRPEDFVVREGYRFENDPDGEVFVYRMDKQKVSTLAALERLSKEFSVKRRNLSVCGLKDKQGRTEQLVGVAGGALGLSDVVQSGDLRLELIGRTAQPLSSGNITANRFEVTVRDLSKDEAARVPESVAEVQRAGVVNYFDSQRFGFLKHGQGFIGKQLIRGDFEGALKSYLATPSELDKSDDARVKTFWRDHWGEWGLRAPQDAGRRYAPMLRQLRLDPTNFKDAFLHIDRRIRMMALFELQSYIWNEGAKRYLMNKVPQAELIGLRYQAGALVLPRSLPRELRDELWGKTFPLLAPDSKFTDKEIESAAMGALAAQQLRLADLQVPETRQLFFKHEERPLFVVPGKLRVNEPREDEMNRRRLKVNLSFTLPPGAYATLVVRRVLWFAAETKREDAEQVGRSWGRPVADAPSRNPRAPAPEEAAPLDETPAEPKPQTPKMGFRERQKRKKEARAANRSQSETKPAATRSAKTRPAKTRPAKKR